MSFYDPEQDDSLASRIQVKMKSRKKDLYEFL